MPLQPVDLVLFKEKFDSASELAHGLGFLRMHLIQIQFRSRQLDTEFLERAVMRFFVELGGMQHRLGRNTADIEAGAAKRLTALHTGCLQAELGSADRRDIAARASANDKNIIIKFGIRHQTAPRFFCIHVRRPVPWRNGRRSSYPYRSISKRIGSSSASFIRTSAVTASRPSIKR